MTRRIGPEHDRIRLTSHEARAFARVQRALTSSPGGLIASPKEIRAGLNVRASVLLICICGRRPAICLLPVGCAGVVITLSRSVIVASVFAAIWTVGLAALLAEGIFQIRRRNPNMTGRVALPSRHASDGTDSASK